MSEYTPTTKEIQSVWGLTVHRDKREERFREFGRWLQQERAKAWAEAYKQGFQAGTKTGDTHYIADNPYLKEETE